MVDHLKQQGYPVMKQRKDSSWISESSGLLMRDAHVFPYFKGSHAVMEKLPDAAIVVASNKGGRGLDLKLDGSCPESSTGTSRGPVPGNGCNMGFVCI